MTGGWRMLGWASASCLVILIVHLTGTDLTVLLLGGISLAGIWHIAKQWRGGGREQSPCLAAPRRRHRLTAASPTPPAQPKQTPREG